MTEPTDAELDELRQANSGRLNFVTFSEFRTIARAVLAKWGTPPAVAGEPYGYLFTAQEATIVGDERKSMREVFTRKKPPCASVALYTTPQPTKAQAGAVPLTDEQIRELWHDSLPNRFEAISFARAIERAHGIAGGQHGAE